MTVIGEPAAVVGGGAARVLGSALRSLARSGAFDDLRPHVRLEVLEAIASLEQAGARWLGDAAKADAVARRARSLLPDRLTVDQAAQLLGYSRVWVRQLARGGEWDAAKAAGRWTVDRASVLEELERRKA